MLLDNLKDIFLKALKYTPALEQKAMIDFWNKECDSVWKDKEALIKETRAACRAGISPEEIAHAKDLLAAEKDGRVVALPCKVGDMVYVTIRGYIEETEVRTLFFGHPSYSGGAPDPHYYRIRCENLDLRWDAIGKTVFLTRDEAEKALGRSKDER